MAQLKSNDNPTGLIIDEWAKNYLLESAKWARVVATIGIAILGLLFLSGIGYMIKGSFLYYGPSPFLSVFLGVTCLFIASVSLYPLTALLRYGTKLDDAVKNQNQIVLEESFRGLKNYFKYISISIVVLVGIIVLCVFLVAVKLYL